MDTQELSRITKASHVKSALLVVSMIFLMSPTASAGGDDAMYDLDSSADHFSDYETKSYGAGHAFQFEKQKKVMRSAENTSTTLKPVLIDTTKEEEILELSQNEVAGHHPSSADESVETTPTPTESEGFRIKLNHPKKK